jgi:hypothetical protein
MTQFIVAEVSKNWSLNAAGRSPEFIQQAFEKVIEVNRARGYQLHSWQLHRLMVTPEQMNETIIAVFERFEAAGAQS